MGLLKTIFRYLIYILIINIMVIFIVVLSLNSLFYPGIYTKSFEKNNLYDFFSNALNNGSTNSLSIIPKNDTKLWIDEKIDTVFSYVRSDTEILDLNTKIDRESIMTTLEKGLEKTQICSEGMSPVQNNQVICKPINMSKREFLNFLFDNNYIKKPAILDQENIDLKETLDKDNNILKLRNLYSTYKIIKIVIFILLLLFIFLLFLLYLDSMENFLRSVEIILIVSGIIGIIVSFAIVGISSGKINTLVAGDDGLGPMFRALAMDIIQGLSNKILITSIVVLIIGIIMLTASLIYTKVHKNNQINY